MFPSQSPPILIPSLLNIFSFQTSISLSLNTFLPQSPFFLVFFPINVISSQYLSFQCFPLSMFSPPKTQYLSLFTCLSISPPPNFFYSQCPSFSISSFLNVLSFQYLSPLVSSLLNILLMSSQCFLNVFPSSVPPLFCPPLPMFSAFNIFLSSFNVLLFQ